MANVFCHIELTTQDVDGAKKFYGDLFDWKMENVSSDDDMPYHMISTGGKPDGGLMGAPSPDMPSAWLAYVQVDDVNKAAKKAASLGGHVAVGKTPIPDNGGHFAVLIDPAGAAIGIWEPPA